MRVRTTAAPSLRFAVTSAPAEELCRAPVSALDVGSATKRTGSRIRLLAVGDLAEIGLPLLSCEMESIA